MNEKLGYGCLVKLSGAYQDMIGVYLGSNEFLTSSEKSGYFINDSTTEMKRIHFVRLSHGVVCVYDTHINFFQRVLVMDDKVEFFSHGSMVRGVVSDVDYDSFQVKIKPEFERTESVMSIPMTTIRLQKPTPNESWNYSNPCNIFDTEYHFSHVVLPLQRFIELNKYGLLDKYKNYHFSNGSWYDPKTDATQHESRDATHVFIKINPLNKKAFNKWVNLRELV